MIVGKKNHEIRTAPEASAKTGNKSRQADEKSEDLPKLEAMAPATSMSGLTESGWIYFRGTVRSSVGCFIHWEDLSLNFALIQSLRLIPSRLRPADGPDCCRTEHWPPFVSYPLVQAVHLFASALTYNSFGATS